MNMWLAISYQLSAYVLRTRYCLVLEARTGFLAARRRGTRMTEKVMENPAEVADAPYRAAESAGG
ncbi:hypothetical protein, partial [Moorena sp. SIO3H5]|uniref:hypothetical protein n=1 Tax=Moorena sp. SIO3H5 TaxID=2607834 RepID=UPI0025D6E814